MYIYTCTKGTVCTCTSTVYGSVQWDAYTLYKYIHALKVHVRTSAKYGSAQCDMYTHTYMYMY